MSNIDTISDFEYKGKQLLLKTSNLQKYINYVRYQNGADPRWFQHHKILNGALSLQQLQNITSHIIWEKFQAFNEIYLSNINTDNIKKIIDVGSGVASTDILLSQYLPTVDFYLVDKDTIKFPKIPTFFSNSLDEENYHGFYNSFDLIKDTVEYSGVNEEKINLLSPDDQWPEDVDIIFSINSWMWHYHKDIYWSRLLKSLKVGGYLMIVMNLRKGETTVEDICMDLGAYPIKCIEIDHDRPKSRDRRQHGHDQIISEKVCIWQRLR